MSPICIPIQHPDPRPLPEGWTVMYDMKSEAWYYMNTSVTSPYPAFAHTLGPLSVQNTTGKLHAPNQPPKKSRVPWFLRSRMKKTEKAAKVEASDMPSDPIIMLSGENTEVDTCPPLYELSNYPNHNAAVNIRKYEGGSEETNCEKSSANNARYTSDGAGHGGYDAREKRGVGWRLRRIQIRLR